LTYAELLDLVEGEIGNASELVLLAESFSGPLAIWLAASRPEQVRAVVLSTSFVRPPRPQWLRWLVWPCLFRLPLPNFAARAILLGRTASPALVQDLQKAVRHVSPAVFAKRLSEVLKVDCTSALAACNAPLLYLKAADDRLVNAAAAATIRRIRPDLEIRELPGPHMLLQTQPAAAWQAIDQFLQQYNIT
jgi:pimeloyl-ACP methyl ester carboxylesterase